MVIPGRVEKPHDEVSSQFEQLLASYSSAHTNTTESLTSQGTELVETIQKQNIVSSESEKSIDCKDVGLAKEISCKNVGTQTEEFFAACPPEKPLPSQTVKVPFQNSMKNCDTETTNETSPRIKEERVDQHEIAKTKINWPKKRGSNGKDAKQRKTKSTKNASKLRKRKRISYNLDSSDDDDHFIKSEPMESDEDYQPFYGDLLKSGSEGEGEDSVGYDAIEKFLHKGDEGNRNRSMPNPEQNLEQGLGQNLEQDLKQNLEQDLVQDLDGNAAVHELEKIDELENVKKEVKFVERDGKFFCTLCGSGHRDRSGWIEHVRSHTGERPYKCMVCFRAFIRKRTLVRHEKIHKRPSKNVINVSVKNEIESDSVVNQNRNDKENSNGNEGKNANGSDDIGLISWNDVENKGWNDGGNRNEDDIEQDDGDSSPNSSEEEEGENTVDLEALERKAEGLETPIKVRGPKRQKVNGKYVCGMCSATYNQVCRFMYIKNLIGEITIN